MVLQVLGWDAGMLGMLERNWRLLPLVALPGLAGGIAAALCPMSKDQGADIPFRPPAWVFAAAWPLLYLFFGAAWFMAVVACGPCRWRAAALSIPYAVCTAALTAWIPVRGSACGSSDPARRRRHAFWLLLLAEAAATYCAALPGQPTASRLLSMVLLCWLGLAILMSAHEFPSHVEHGEQRDPSGQ